MTADAAQRLVARCLVDPDYLDAGGPAFPPGPDGPAPAGDDDLAGRLRLFRGFIMRMKHGQLRKVTPLTLRLLALHRADITFFAEAAPDYFRARQQGRLATPDLLARFEQAFAHGLRDLAPGARRQIDGVLRHEARIWRTARATDEPRAATHPRLASGAAVEVYDFSLLEVCAALARDPFALPDAGETPQALLYLRDGTGMRILEIDGLSAWVLSRLDGAASLAALDRDLSLALGAEIGDAVADIVADAIARGFAEGPTVAAAAA